MDRWEAEQFELAIQQAAQGQPVPARLRPLVQIAALAGTLAEPPPPAPNRLLPGRQRFLTEAARLRLVPARRRTRPSLGSGVVRLATALVLVLLTFGLVFGAGRAAAEGLPGQPLYGLKLAAEGARLTLTRDPQARAELHLALAEERLEEIVRLTERGRPVGAPLAQRAERELLAALQGAAGVEAPSAVRLLQRLDLAIERQQPAMAAAEQGLPESERAGLRRVLSAMERVRREAQVGQGDPEELRRRLREGLPPEPGPSPERPGPQPTGSPTREAAASPSPTPKPPDPTATAAATRTPALGPRPTHTPAGVGTGEPRAPAHPSAGAGSGPQAPHATEESEAAPEPGSGATPTHHPEGSGPGPESTAGPDGPEATEEPEPGPKPTVAPGGPGPGPQPTDEGDDSKPTEEPGHGPGPTDEPGHGPEPTEESGNGPGPTDGHTGSGSESGR